MADLEKSHYRPLYKVELCAKIAEQTCIEAHGQYLWDRLPEFFEDNSIYEMEHLLTTFPEALRTVSRYSASDVIMNVDLPYFRYFLLPFPATASSKQEAMVDYVLIDEIKAEA